MTTTERRIFRYFGSIDAERALHGSARGIIEKAIETEFGVTPYKVKMVAKKLTRFHTYRHFIAYFNADQHGKVREVLDACDMVVVENRTERVVFHDSRNSDRPCPNHYRVTLDLNPMKAIPQDNGLAISYDVEAPVNPSITPRRSRREARRSNTPPTSGTPAQAPSTVR